MGYSGFVFFSDKHYKHIIKSHRFVVGGKRNHAKTIYPYRVIWPDLTLMSIEIISSTYKKWG